MKFNIGLTELIALVSLVIAVIGAVLGIINTIYRFSKDKVRLKVTPQIMVRVGDSTLQEGIFINIVNLSTFPITVNQIGLKCSKTSLLCPLIFQNQFPSRIASHSDHTFTFVYPIQDAKDLYRVKKAFAVTACGKTFYGNSKWLKDKVKEAKKPFNKKDREG